MKGKDTRGYPYLGPQPDVIYEEKDRPQHRELHALVVCGFFNVPQFLWRLQYCETGPTV